LQALPLAHPLGRKALLENPAAVASQKKQGLEHGWSQSLHDDKGLHSMLSVAGCSHPITPYELYEYLGYALFISHHLHGLVAQNLPEPVPHPCKPHLSARELEVLRLSSEGKTAYEIAKILCLAERTINFHVHSAIQKLGVNNKIAAVIAAARACMI
jgi:DNA-binding CsgD family transcriptional regulator